VGFDLALAATTFALIFPAELPDKTFIATLVLATRYRHLPVWLGVSTAFFVQVVIAVTFGGFLALLPPAIVYAVTTLLFAIGAVILIRGGLRSRAAERVVEATEEQEFLQQTDARSIPSGIASGWKVFVTSFVILFTAEWGDLSQLLTAGMAARTGQPFSVGVGSWLALITVAGLAVVLGRWLQQRVLLWRIRLVSGAILAALAVWTASELVRSFG
jgi:Ca2+/H+ antiporter, TMEM165/GDT1 family